MSSSFNPFSLEGKTIFVTGASSGIGKGIAMACAKMGGGVIAQGRNEERLKQTLSEMPGENHSMLLGDLTFHENIIRIVEKLPVIDGVVHCAGVGLLKLCRQLEESDIDFIMNTNFKAPVMLQTEIIRQKKLKRGASIVFITSIAPEISTIGNSVYSASKGAIKAFAKCLSNELSHCLVRVNCLSPAMVWTDFAFRGGLTIEDLQEDEKRYPLKRYGKPEDIANAAIYLLSDASSWMSNSDIRITGGLD